MQAQATTHEIVHINPDRDIFFEITHDSHEVSQRHWHEAMELIYITKGILYVTVNGHVEQLKEGDCIIINSRVIHSTNGSPGNDGIVIQFPISFLSRYLPDFDRCYFDLDTHNKEPHHQTKLLQLKTVLENMAVVEDVQPDGGTLRFNSLLFELLFELYHNFRIPVTPSSVTDVRKTLDSIIPVIDYTQEHYRDPISIAEISDVVHLQPEYFCRKFKHLMGQTYLEYLNEVRLSYVYEDLIHTDLPLNQILEKHGFTNYKLFRRLFREKFSCTPGSLRKADRDTGSSITGRTKIQPQLYDTDPTHDRGLVREL